MAKLYLGLLSFLRTKENVGKSVTFRCQCPILAFSHFYEDPVPVEPEDPVGVNALLRVSPISTNVNVSARLEWVFVSMPYIGLLPFLHYPLETRINKGLPGSFLQVIH